jgi:hypothetical protein
MKGSHNVSNKFKHTYKGLKYLQEIEIFLIEGTIIIIIIIETGGGVSLCCPGWPLTL